MGRARSMQAAAGAAFIRRLMPWFPPETAAARPLPDGAIDPHAVPGPRPAQGAAAERRPGAAGERLREDIQGLRVVAVMLVVLFHLWPDRVPGGYVGVDVFFVISGYLITGHLIRRPPRTGRDLATFWARRIRRLLPASLLVLAVTLLATRIFAPALTWATTAREALAAALYVENWSLAQKAVDYLAADADPTAVQHFWSLSTEEQFYLVWPVLLLVLFLLARPAAGPSGPAGSTGSTGSTGSSGTGIRRRRPGARTAVGCGMAVVLLLSLACSVWLTGNDPARAYFVTFTRAWEFAAGGLVAGLPAGIAGRTPRPVRALLCWCGLAAVLVAGLRFTGATPFPGHAALLPVVGTAVVILFRGDGWYSAQSLWRLPGVQWTGGVSYSVYLWHWPLIILLPYVKGAPAGTADRLGILALTVVLSGLTKTFVEDRFRVARPGSPLRGTYRAAAAGMVVVLGLGAALHAEAGWRERAARRALDRAIAGQNACFGADAAERGFTACPQDPRGPLVPDLSLAAEDKSDAYDDHCFTNAPYTARATCTYGTGPIKVALVGNSHAGQWLPAVQRLADQRGWTVTTYLVSYCNISTARPRLPDPVQADNCVALGRWVGDRTSDGSYDLVITSARQSTLIAGNNWVGTDLLAQRAYRGFLRRWAAAGTRVLVVKDPVAPGDSIGRIPECLAKAGEDRDRCSWPLERPVPADPRQYRYIDPLWSAARGMDDDPLVKTVEMDDLVCPQGRCRPVIGGVVTFSDASHLTATYVSTMTPMLGRRITRAFDDL